MSASKADGIGGPRAGVEEEDGGDVLLASLADELVWKGEDGEEEGDEYADDDDEDYDGYEFEEGETLEGLDLESLGISMMVRGLFPFATTTLPALCCTFEARRSVQAMDLGV